MNPISTKFGRGLRKFLATIPWVVNILTNYDIFSNCVNL